MDILKYLSNVDYRPITEPDQDLVATRLIVDPLPEIKDLVGEEIVELKFFGELQRVTGYSVEPVNGYPNAYLITKSVSHE